LNAKKAKGLRKLIKHAHKNLNEHAFKEMGIGLSAAQLTVAGDTQRGQYLAMKRRIKGEYKK
jgi:hypothetical protein